MADHPRRDRISITLSYAMMAALEYLAERNTLPIATQAQLVLRQALDRTIASAEVQRRIAGHNAYRTRQQWRDETTTDFEIERRYAQQQTTAKSVQPDTAGPSHE